MRILMINNHFSFGGGGDASFRHERLVYEEAGYSVHTFAHEISRPAEAGASDYVAIESSNRLLRKTQKYLGNPAMHDALKRVLTDVDPDLVHVHLAQGYPTSIFSALTDYPVMHTLHGPNMFCATSWGCIKNTGQACEQGTGLKCYTRGCVSLATLPMHMSLAWRTARQAKRNVDVYLCPSKQIQRTAENLGFKPAEYFPLSIDRRFMAVEPHLFDGPPTILYVGGLTEQKGVLVLLEAFAEVKRRVPDARLVYAGTGALQRALQQRAAELRCADSVEFRGFVARDDIVATYQSAHVVAVPSIWNEQFGLVGPEALACGVPCVGSNIGGIPEWLHDGQWGYTVQPRNSLALAERLVALLTDRARCQELGLRGREFVLRAFGPEQFKNNVLDLAERYGRRTTWSTLKSGGNLAQPIANS